MKAKSIHGDSTAAIQTALQQSLSDGFTPKLAIVFISVTQDRNAVCALLKEHHIDVLGATSAGEFADGHESQQAIVILLLDIDKISYRLSFFPTKDKDLAEVAKQAGRNAMEAFSNPAFILCTTGISGAGEMFA